MGGVRRWSFGGSSARVRVAGLVSLLFTTLTLAFAPPAGAVIGGSELSITAAPWQAEVVFYELTASLQLHDHYCGGVIIGERRIVTAAHCLINPKTGQLVKLGEHPELGKTSEGLNAGAGTSDVLSPEEPTEQGREVTAFQVDPSFVYSTTKVSPDDVAVVEVNEPFVFGSVAQPIALASTGTPLEPGTAVGLSGYGEGASEEIGKLNALNTTLVSSTECGGASAALFLCASTPRGSTCFEDSGSPLTLPGPPTTLVGMVDRVEPAAGEPCEPGVVDTFVNLTAPSIREFIKDATPIPTITKAPSSGTPQEQSKGATEQQPVAKSALRATATKLSVSKGSAIVQLDCTGAATCKGTLTLIGTQTKKVKGKRRKVTVTLGTESFSIAAGKSAKVKVKLSSYARGQLKSTHGHLHASLSLLGRETEPTQGRIENVTIL